MTAQKGDHDIRGNGVAYSITDGAGNTLRVVSVRNGVITFGAGCSFPSPLFTVAATVNGVFVLNQDFTDTSGVKEGLFAQVSADPSGTSTAAIFGALFTTQTLTSNSNNITGSVIGFSGEGHHYSPGTLSSLIGSRGWAQTQTGSGTVASAAGMVSQVATVAGTTMTVAYGFRVDISNLGAIGTFYGSYLPASGATNDYGVYSLANKNHFAHAVDVGGLLGTAASTTGGAGLNIAPGVAPSSPNNGDVWTTTAGLYAQINGSTVGPFGSGGGGSGTVTTVSVASANGFAGTVANATTTPAITLTTTITGLLKGNGTAISAAVSGTDYCPAAGDASIVTVGTIGTGVWQGTAVAAAYLGAHASTHQHGGSDPVATGTPAAYAIPQALSSGFIDDGWLSADIIKNSGANAFAGNQSMGGNKLTNLGTPTAAGDAASKSYVDATASGLSLKNSCQAATASALPSNVYNNGSSGVGATLTMVSTGVVTIDGYTPVLNDRVLVKNEATGANNGIYSVTVAGAIGVALVLTRTTDSNTAAELETAFTFIENGTANAATGWVNTNTGTITIGTTALTYTQFSGAGTYTNGTGLALTGNVFSVNYGSSGSTACVGNDSRLSDARTPVGSALTSAHIWVGNGSNVAASVAMSGNVTIDNTGATTIGNSVVTNAMLAGSIAASKLVGTDIATVGTITAGIWHGTKIGTLYGGTGLDTSAAANGTLLIGNGSGLSLATLTAGSNITITNGSGTITIAASGGSVSIGGAVGSSTNYDILSIDGSGNLSQISPSTSGYVLTSNGTSAAATFQAAVTGSTCTGTFGEAVTVSTTSLIVYLDLYGERTLDNWFRADNAATGPVKVSQGWGIIKASATNGGTQTVYLPGQTVGGFTGLTTGSPVWLSTSGTVTQTKPSAASGSQVVIVLLGYATSATVIYFNPSRISFEAYNSALTNGSSITVEHCTDAEPRSRIPFAYSSITVTIYPSGLAYWPTTEGSGTTTAEVTGNGSAGSLGSNYTWSATVPTLHLTGTQSLSGSGSSSSLPASSVTTANSSFLSFTKTSTFSMSLWIKTSTATQGLLCKYDASAGAGYFIMTLSNNIYFQICSSGSNYIYRVGNVNVSTNSWINVIVTYDGSVTTGGMRIYTNGTENTYTSASNGTVGTITNTKNFLFGSRDADGYPLTGLMCDVRVYNFVLNSTQIANLKNGYNEDGTTSYSTYSFDSPFTVTWWSDASPTGKVLVRHDDGSNANGDIKTTFKNQSGSTVPFTAQVQL